MDAWSGLKQLLEMNVGVHNYNYLQELMIFDTDEVQELKLVLSSDAKSKSS